MKFTHQPVRRNRSFRKTGPALPELAGTVTRWEDGETYGFITGDDHVSYFLSRDELPQGLTSVAVGTVVRFTSASAPPPGARYLHALSVRVVSVPAAED